jgi:hypothetical protein
MRLLIVCGTLALSALASLTPADAQRGCSGLGCQCRVQCGVQGRGNVGPQQANVQACVSKCVQPQQRGWRKETGRGYAVGARAPGVKRIRQVV